jgi:hypothetical protein
MLINTPFILIDYDYEPPFKTLKEMNNFLIQQLSCKITELESQIENLNLDIKCLQKRCDY